MSIVIFLILIKWVLHNMSGLENKTKVIYLVVGIIVISIISLIIFNISRGKIEYPNEQVFKEIRKMLLLLFIPMNGLIILPYLASLLEKIKLEEIKQDSLMKKIIIFAVIVIVILIFESKYLMNSQIGILAFYHN